MPDYVFITKDVTTGKVDVTYNDVATTAGRRQVRINKNSVSRIVLAVNTELGDVVHIVFNSGHIEELHFSYVDKVGDNTTINDSQTLYDELLILWE